MDTRMLFRTPVSSRVYVEQDLALNDQLGKIRFTNYGFLNFFK